MKIVLLLLLTLILNSCYTNYHTVGSGPTRYERKELFSKGKDVYLFWGLAKLGDSEPKHPMNDYLIRTRFSFGDQIISFLTAGLVSTRTTKVFVVPSDKVIEVDGNYPTNGSIPRLIDIDTFDQLPFAKVLEKGDYVFFKNGNTIKKGKVIHVGSFSSTIQEYEAGYKKLYYIEVDNNRLKKAP